MDQQKFQNRRLHGVFIMTAPHQKEFSYLRNNSFCSYTPCTRTLVFVKYICSLYWLYFSV